MQEPTVTEDAHDARASAAQVRRGVGHITSAQWDTVKQEALTTLAILLSAILLMLVL